MSTSDKLFPLGPVKVPFAKINFPKKLKREMEPAYDAETAVERKPMVTLPKSIIMEAAAATVTKRHLSPSSSPVPFSPTGMSNSSSPTPSVSNSVNAAAAYASPKISGIPLVAAASKYTAPVHIDVGGTIYTSSLETLTKFPDSRLAKMFSGSIPIVLDSLKQHYFIDRDGEMFRHILNYMRNNKLLISSQFPDIDLLLEEARFYEIQGMIKHLEQVKKEKERPKDQSSPQDLSNNGSNNTTGHHYLPHKMPIRHSKTHFISSSSGNRSNIFRQICVTAADNDTSEDAGNNAEEGRGARPTYECLALNISPDLGERLMLSGPRSLIEEAFPETAEVVMDVRTSVAWHHDARHVIRFPLNGYCKLNSVQAITRLLNAGFTLAASHGGGVDSQQFSEYLFVRQVLS